MVLTEKNFNYEKFFWRIITRFHSMNPWHGYSNWHCLDPIWRTLIESMLSDMVRLCLTPEYEHSSLKYSGKRLQDPRKLYKELSSLLIVRKLDWKIGRDDDFSYDCLCFFIAMQSAYFMTSDHIEFNWFHCQILSFQLIWIELGSSTSETGYECKTL